MKDLGTKLKRKRRSLMPVQRKLRAFTTTRRLKCMKQDLPVLIFFLFFFFFLRFSYFSARVEDVLHLFLFIGELVLFAMLVSGLQRDTKRRMAV